MSSAEKKAITLYVNAVITEDRVTGPYRMVDDLGEINFGAQFLINCFQ